MDNEEFDYEKHVCELCEYIDKSIDSADVDAAEIYRSIDRFISKGLEIDDGEEHIRDIMSYNFYLTDKVIHERINVFSLISLIELLDKNDKIAKALKGHAKNHKARAFVESEWAKHRGEYSDNKSAFTRDYVKRVFNELDVSVTEKQMREVWLKDTLPASKPDGMPANG